MLLASSVEDRPRERDLLPGARQALPHPRPGAKSWRSLTSLRQAPPTLNEYSDTTRQRGAGGSPHRGCRAITRSHSIPMKFTGPSLWFRRRRSVAGATLFAVARPRSSSAIQSSERLSPRPITPDGTGGTSSQQLTFALTQ